MSCLPIPYSISKSFVCMAKRLRAPTRQRIPQTSSVVLTFLTISRNHTFGWDATDCASYCCFCWSSCALCFQALDVVLWSYTCSHHAFASCISCGCHSAACTSIFGSKILAISVGSLSAVGIVPFTKHSKEGCRC